MADFWKALNESVTAKDEKIKQLKQQIEKMKNCNNCKYNESTKKQNLCSCNYCCNNCSKWEMAE